MTSLALEFSSPDSNRNFPGQWFSDWTVQQDPRRAGEDTGSWTLPRELPVQWGWGQTREYAFPTSSQGEPMPLVQGPPFENHVLGETEK